MPNTVDICTDTSDHYTFYWHQWSLHFYWYQYHTFTDTSDCYTFTDTSDHTFADTSYHYTFADTSDHYTNLTQGTRLCNGNSESVADSHSKAGNNHFLVPSKLSCCLYNESWSSSLLGIIQFQRFRSKEYMKKHRHVLFLALSRHTPTNSFKSNNCKQFQINWTRVCKENTRSVKCPLFHTSLWPWKLYIIRKC